MQIAQMHAHSLVPLIPSLLQTLHGILVPVSTRAQDAGYFSFQLTLYESFGLLIGQTPDDNLQVSLVLFSVVVASTNITVL
jgi:hypothetical protein